MNEREIFIDAIQLDNPAARAEFLQRACASDAALRERVESLLSVYDRASTFPESPVDRPRVKLDQPEARETPGTVIGPYKLLQQIGEGGMGTVYMAEQTQPVQRMVALKVIKPGMDSRQVIARFEAERQALAVMDHVNIARVIDIGATDAGRPYFVMELVHGVPITKYCDDNHLTPRERLELFVPVCQAIQHAHQKGIIHRDIKPSNVMITLYDGKPVPKVIDFGVAKAIEQKLTERTLFTQYGAIVGTLEYMSPEQAEMSALGVDTRSDIFSLGVLLYELLTGSTPLSSQRLKEAAFGEILRMIREEEPPRPSVRLNDSGEALASISALRHMEPAKLTKLVRGELDWIVMKTLEKDRTRRYETANAFTADVQRYLNDEAVEACPSSTGYRLRKFARRHKAAFRIAAAFVCLLFLGVVVSTWQAVRATLAQNVARAAERAVGEERDKVLAENERANDEAAIALAVNDFLQNDLLAEAAPDRNSRNKKVTVEELLGRASARIAGKFGNQPRIEAAIRQTIGDTYRKLGDHPAALPHMEAALDIRRRVLGGEHPDTLNSMNNLGLLYREQGRLTLAEPLLVTALEVRRRVLGEEHPDTIKSMINLAGLYLVRGRPFPEAETLLRKALEIGRHILGEGHRDVLLAMNNLAVLYRRLSRFNEAEPLLIEAVEVSRRVFGKPHPDTLMFTNHLGILYWTTRKFDLAAPLFEEVLGQRRAGLGSDHPDTLFTMIHLGINHLDAGRPNEAVLLLDEALEWVRKRSGSIPFELMIILPEIPDAYERAGQFVSAEPLRREALAKMQAQHGEEIQPVAGYLSRLGSNLLRQEKYVEAERLMRQCLKIRDAWMPDDWMTFDTRSMLGGSLLGQKQFAEAEPLLLAGYEGMTQREVRIPAELKIRLTQSMDRLVQLYEATGQKEKAAEWRKKREQPKDPPMP